HGADDGAAHMVMAAEVLSVNACSQNKSLTADCGWAGNGTPGRGIEFAFLAGVSPVMHDFWKQSQPEQRMNEMINFTKNLALIGGAIALMAVEEPWPASVPVLAPKKSLMKRVLREVAS